HVEDQEIAMQPEQLGPRIAGARGRGDAVAFAGKEARQQIADAAVVVDQQHMRGVVGRLCRRSRCGHHRARIHALLTFKFWPIQFLAGLPLPKMVSSTLSGSSRSIIARRNWRTVSVPAGPISAIARLMRSV